mgnify:CR=1 FL=1|tara:strand:+ start:163 stop:528 length:366 start_codon:yes stop_codon:yes gene_type:complete
MKYARKCDYTGKGMNTGYVFVDDSCMVDDRELFIKELRKDREGIINLIPKNIQDISEFDNSCNLNFKEVEVLYNKVKNALNNTETDEELCDIAYAVDYYYWTEWEDEFEYQEINGVLTEIE